MTYRQVVQDILADTPNASADFSDVANRPIGRPLIQYEETDWAFIKRLASMVGTQLIPDCTSPIPHFSFGAAPNRQQELNLTTYSILLDKRFYKMGGSAAGLYKPDFFCYIVSDTQYYQLGSQVLVEGRPLVICEQTGELCDGEITYTYKVGQPGLLCQREIRNEKLTGLHLSGTVSKTEYEVVNLKLDIDAGRDAGSYPFQWTPESGNIMYCMPKVGTRATLGIPDQDISEAVAITSPRVNGGDCPTMADPQMRLFTSEHGKRMALYPESIQFSGGLPNETLQIQLNQLDCILMESTKSIQLVAQLSIDISAPQVTMNSPQEVRTSRSQVQAQAKVGMIIPKGTGCGNPSTGGGDTVMLMQFQFDALGEQGVLCGTEFTEYPAYDDAPEEFDFSGWMVNILVGVAIAAVCVIGAVLTGGLLGAALFGAAMGAAAVTATIAIEDWNDGDVRGLGTAVGQIAFGATIGAAVGATGAYIMPYGTATIGTFAKFGVFSGAATRVATSGAMEHINSAERLGYVFNPLSMAADAFGGMLVGGISNYFRQGTAFPSQQMVNTYNTQQAAQQAAQAARIAQESAEQADDALKLNEPGTWTRANESMSPASRDYQKFVTGADEGMVYKVNGVKFDGFKNGVLLEAKGNYANFVNKKTGEFYSWFKGQDTLVNQARRQLSAANGTEIQWYFNDEVSLNAVRELFMDKSISGIGLNFLPMK